MPPTPPNSPPQPANPPLTRSATIKKCINTYQRHLGNAKSNIEEAEGELNSSSELRTQLKTLIRQEPDPSRVSAELEGLNLYVGLADTNRRIRELQRYKWLARKYVFLMGMKVAVSKAKLVVVEKVMRNGDEPRGEPGKLKRAVSKAGSVIIEKVLCNTEGLMAESSDSGNER